MNLGKVNVGINNFNNVLIVENYPSLPLASDFINKMYFVKNSQGTRWLPGSLGGTYYSSGIYYSNGITWSTVDTPYFSTQTNVDNGLITDQFISPATLNNYSGWTAAKVGLNFIDEETPIGIINGTNNIFSTQFTVKSGTLKVFLNGMRLKNIEDFTYINNTITMVNIPYIGDKLLTDYRY